jgi:hypothetical protein
MSLHALPPLERVRGTRVWLPRPEGFVETTQFTGWADPATGAVLMASELPDPYPALAEGLSAMDRTPGMRVLSRDPLTAGAHTGLLVHVEQEQRGILFDKWMAVLGDAERSVMVVASARAEHGPSLSGFLRTLVAAVRWEPAREEPLEGVPFVLGDPQGLRPASRIQHGVLYTPDGRAPAPDSLTPQLLVTPLPLPPGMELSPREMAEAAVQRTPGVEGATLTDSSPVLVRGMRGHEVVASGGDAAGRALFVYLLVVAGPQGPVLVQGRGAAEAREEELPRLQAAARSVQAAR